MIAGQAAVLIPDAEKKSQDFHLKPVVANNIFQKFIYDMHQNNYHVLICQRQQSRFQINFL